MNKIFEKYITQQINLSPKIISNDTKLLVTCQIFYHLPDFPSLIQSFILQKIDIHPYYPELNKFLDYWEMNIEAPINSVDFTSGLINLNKVNHVNGIFLIN